MDFELISVAKGAHINVDYFASASLRSGVLAVSWVLGLIFVGLSSDFRLSLDFH